MKYRVNCTSCGCSYEVAQDFAPRFCSRCGFDGIAVAASKTKSRITAENKMCELDEIRPRLESAWKAYFDARVEYEDGLVFLAQYYKRGIISAEEYDPYRIRSQNFKININDAVREYRKNKRTRGAE